MHAWEWTQEEDGELVVPGLQAIAKSFAGRYQPASALLVGEKIASFMNKEKKVFTHGHTYQDHPVVAAAALEAQRIIEDEKLLTNVIELGEQLEEVEEPPA